MSCIETSASPSGSSSFDRAFEELLELEGGYVNDPQDPGGETKYGISKQSYPDEDIANLTAARAKAIYCRDYWVPLRLDELHPSVAKEVFEVSINTSRPGLRRSMGVKLLQRALNFLGSGVTEDGLIGPETLTAADLWTKNNLEALVKAQNGEQYRYFCRVNAARKRRGDPQPFRFAAGWLRRVAFNEVQS